MNISHANHLNYGIASVPAFLAAVVESCIRHYLKMLSIQRTHSDVTCEENFHCIETFTIESMCSSSTVGLII